jgi:hypothetical protein
MRYSLTVDDEGAREPLVRFLFEGMAGHCEYFATTMVVLARSVGIPARLVLGYLSGEVGFDERYTVRQSHAHAWAEVYFPEQGWIAFDATPSAGLAVEAPHGLWSIAAFLHSSLTRLWDDHLVGLDLDDQMRGFLALSEALADWTGWLRRVGAALAPLGALAALVLLARLIRGRRETGRGESERERETAPPSFYAQTLALLARHGLARRAAETPAELAARAHHVLTGRGVETLQELTHLYYRVRYDGATGEAQVARIAGALAADLRLILESKQWPSRNEPRS